MNALREIHRFETNGGQISDFKALVVELRSLFAKAQGEMLAMAMRNQSPAVAYQVIYTMFTTATQQCNVIALMSESKPEMDTKFLASTLVYLGNFTSIESMFNSMNPI